MSFMASMLKMLPDAAAQGLIWGNPGHWCIYNI